MAGQQEEPQRGSGEYAGEARASSAPTAPARRSRTGGTDDVHALAEGCMPLDETERLRTAPVPVFIAPEHQLAEWGIEDLLDHAYASVVARRHAAERALFEAGATSDDRAQAAALTYEINREPDVRSYNDKRAALEELRNTIVQRGRERDPRAAGRYGEACSERERLMAMWASDVEEYRRAVIGTARRLLDQRGIAAPVILEEGMRPWPMHGELYDALGDTITSEVLERAPLPMTGKAPDYSHGTPADAVRRAGRCYLERLEESTRPHA